MKRLAVADSASNVGSAASISSINRHVGQRIRHRRILLGITQRQLAELTDITYQQVHKYEKGINSISSGLLYLFAQALGTEINYFFEGFEAGGLRQPIARKRVLGQRLLLEMVRNFVSIKSHEHQKLIRHIVRALSDRD